MTEVPTAPSALVSFEPPAGGSFRVVMLAGEPWFLAHDVCRVLDLDVSVAMRRLDEDEYQQVEATLFSAQGGPPRNVVNESGLYSLILGSRKPEARAFKRWVTWEVLPSIRKTGGFGLRELTRKELALAVIEAEEERERAEAALEAARPAIEQHAQFLDTSGSMPLQVVAKALNVGPNRLFAFLRRHRVLIGTAGPRFNTPYQDQVETGRFEVVMGTRERSDGTMEPTYTTRCTAKGQAHIHKLIEKHGRP